MRIDKLLVVFKTHLDIGYTDFASDVTKRYMESYIPEAIRTAELLRKSGDEARLVWTTGSWLIAEYLRTHTGEEREALCRAIRAGDVTWHGLPVTTHTEMMGAELFQYGLSLSQSLDREFGRKTIGAKMTDVPGHTKAIIPYMKRAGVEFLHIGVNPASLVPEVPPLFRWRCESGETINVMYQKDYGEFSPIGDSGTALYFAHTGDNLGVQTPENIIEIFRSLKERFPSAEIKAADLNDLALEVRKIEDTLPVITDEIGDTWIHGIGSDPKKAAQFRALERFYAVLPEGADKETLAQKLLMIPEHTWGLNGQRNLRDHEFFQRSVFEKKRRSDPVFKRMEASWEEQRRYLLDGVSSLTEENRIKAEKLMEEAKRRPIAEGQGIEYSETLLPGEKITFGGCTLRFNRRGEIDLLEKNGHILADQSHRLLTLRYEQFCEGDYQRFMDRYNRLDMEWPWEDFTKIGMNQGIDSYRRYEAESVGIYLWKDKLMVTYSFPEGASRECGCPGQFDLIITACEDGLFFDLAWFQKPVNRMAEAIWLGFRPMAEGKTVQKLGQLIDPVKVVKNGQCRLHGTDYGVVYRDISIETLDSSLVALQEPSLLHFTNAKPEDEEGVYFNLYNNVWATNFPMWYDEDARFRFILHM